VVAQKALALELVVRAAVEMGLAAQMVLLEQLI
jgi:hypothetical protein